MKFEDALTALRNGAKITHQFFDKNVYFILAYESLAYNFSGMGSEEVFELAKNRGWLTIVKMKGNELHPDMRPKFINYPNFESPVLLPPPFPYINLNLLMSDDWEILEIIEENK